MKIDWIRWRPRLLYGGFAFLAFALSLRFTFPTEAVKERVMYEAGQRGWQVEVGRLGPSGVLGLRADQLTVEDRAGLKIPVERLEAGLRVLPLLIGRRVLTLDADFMGGRVRGAVDLSGDPRRVSATLDGVDAARASALHKGGPLLGGKVGGTLELEVPEATGRAGGTLDVVKTSGQLELAVESATLSGQLPLPGFNGGLPLPHVPLGALALRVKVGDGRAAVERLEAKGGQVELSTDGLAVTLQPQLEYAPLSGRAHLHLAPAFWSQPATRDLKPVADMALAPSKVGEGSYQLQVVGTLGHPLLTPGGGARATPGGSTFSGAAEEGH